MDIVTMKSEKARQNWRNILEKTHYGRLQVIVKRYDQPMSVLMGYEQWQKTQERLQVLEAWAEARKGQEDYQSGKTGLVTWEDLQRMAEERYGVGA